MNWFIAVAATLSCLTSAAYAIDHNSITAAIIAVAWAVLSGTHAIADKVGNDGRK